MPASAAVSAIAIAITMPVAWATLRRPARMNVSRRSFRSGGRCPSKFEPPDAGGDFIKSIVGYEPKSPIRIC
jgi:hypothetical protein